jgi:KpsF/GutQ family protein
MRSIQDTVLDSLKIEQNALEAIAETLDIGAIEQIVDALIHCGGRILVSGCGTSGAAAKKIVHTLCCVECPAFYLNPADAVHGGMGALRKGDTLLLISKGGGTSEIVNIIDSCKGKGVTIVGITENEMSVLAQKSDYLLKIKVPREADEYNLLATASTIAVIATMDAIAVCLMERNGFNREKFAVIHPGGDVGDRLLHGKA